VLRQHPLLKAAVCNARVHSLRAELLALGARLPAVPDSLDALPQTYQHGDASPQNLLVPADKPDEFDDRLGVRQEAVRYGYLGSMLARATFTALPLEAFGAQPSDELARLFDQRVRLTRALVDLVSGIN
jgi:hypothetical protein